MDGWHTLVLVVEGAAALTLLHVARRYNLSIPEGRKTVRLSLLCDIVTRNISTVLGQSRSGQCVHYW